MNTVEFDSRKLPPPQKGERVLSADDLLALQVPRMDLQALVGMTIEEKLAYGQHINGELVEAGVIALRKGPNGGFVYVVPPVKGSEA